MVARVLQQGVVRARPQGNTFDAWADAPQGSSGWSAALLRDGLREQGASSSLTDASIDHLRALRASLGPPGDRDPS